jgi:hypothetical protein
VEGVEVFVGPLGLDGGACGPVLGGAWVAWESDGGGWDETVGDLGVEVVPGGGGGPAGVLGALG